MSSFVATGVRGAGSGTLSTRHEAGAGLRWWASFRGAWALAAAARFSPAAGVGRAVARLRRR